MTHSHSRGSNYQSPRASHHNVETLKQYNSNSQDNANGNSRHHNAASINLTNTNSENSAHSAPRLSLTLSTRDNSGNPNLNDVNNMNNGNRFGVLQERVPFDILYAIITFCNIHTRISLSQTCLKFCDIISREECMSDIWIIHGLTNNRKIIEIPNNCKHLSSNNAYNVYNAPSLYYKSILYKQLQNKRSHHNNHNSNTLNRLSPHSISHDRSHDRSHTQSGPADAQTAKMVHFFGGSQLSTFGNNQKTMYDVRMNSNNLNNNNGNNNNMVILPSTTSPAHYSYHSSHSRSRSHSFSSRSQSMSSSVRSHHALLRKTKKGKSKQEEQDNKRGKHKRNNSSSSMMGSVYHRYTSNNNDNNNNNRNNTGGNGGGGNESRIGGSKMKWSHGNKKQRSGSSNYYYDNGSRNTSNNNSSSNSNNSRIINGAQNGGDIGDVKHKKIRKLSVKIRSDKDKKDKANVLSIKPPKSLPPHKIFGEISNDSGTNIPVSPLNGSPLPASSKYKGGHKNTMNRSVTPRNLRITKNYSQNSMKINKLLAQFSNKNNKNSKNRSNNLGHGIERTHSVEISISSHSLRIKNSGQASCNV